MACQRPACRSTHILTPVNDVVVVQVVDSIEDLADRLGGVFLCELSLLANAVEQLAAGSQLGHDVVFVLPRSALALLSLPRRCSPSTRTNRET